MLRHLIVPLGLLIWTSVGLAQQPVESSQPFPRVEAQPAPAPAAPCAKDDYLCILTENLKKKDPSTGSDSGTGGGFIANQPAPGSMFPGNRIDLQFLQKNEVKG